MTDPVPDIASDIASDPIPRSVRSHSRVRATGGSTTPVPTAVLAAVVLGAVVLAGCGDDTSPGAAGPGSAGGVLATTTILADITKNVGCGKVDVPSVIPAGSDAHEYEASVQDADRINGSSLIIANGLDLEEGLIDALGQAEGGGVEVVRVGDGLSPIKAAQHSGVTGGVDPHVWMDPDRMALAAGIISEQLQQVGDLPVSAAEIKACGEAYQAELTALGQEMDGTLAAVPPEHRKLVTNHEALGYFADRFDFEVIGAVIPSTSSLGETNPRDLEELATAVRDAGVPAIFGETTQPAAVARSLADRVGGDVSVVELFTESLGRPGSGADTYVGMMRTDARRVAEALGGAAGAPGTAGAAGAAG